MTKALIPILLVAMLLVSGSAGAGSGRLLPMSKITGLDAIHPDDTPDNTVHHHCITPKTHARNLLDLDRDKPWSLPTQALADPAKTINILVLRFNFEYEEDDDPNTTGRGVMDTIGIGPTAEDSAAYYAENGHWVDPPPHDAYYFNAHMSALKAYWEKVSEGLITLNWVIYPGGYDSTDFLDGATPDPTYLNSTYQLPEEMSHYGRCALDLAGDEQLLEVILGLEAYFEDAIRIADSAQPDINFGQFDSYFLFHAGSDRQNDIGFPLTCSDLFTGYISYKDTVWVDEGTTPVTDAMLMPETTNQDNRGTALNAVLAHEFGHQLGLVDLYRTDDFVSCLGDFALMDHNGFGTAVDFGWDVGRVFGALPIFPSAWSRAYLGFVEVQDFRQGEDIELVAAEIVREGVKVARVPITENEYYLLENRLVETDGLATNMKADVRTNVFLYPAVAVDESTFVNTGEYDFLIPGSGVLIYHVDEAVAYLNNDWYTGDTVNNFNDNKLQWVLGDENPSRKFITLVEADGVVDMSGYYQTYGETAYGWEGDMFRDDRNSDFTPNTNPATIDQSYNDTHIRITDIGRQLDMSSGLPRRNDSIAVFSVEVERLVDGFPVRAGASGFGLSPLVDDLNRDGHPEIIIPSANLINVVTTDGVNFIHQISECDPCVTYADSAKATVHPGKLEPLPLFRAATGPLTANPVVGDFGDDGQSRLVAIGYFYDSASGRVDLIRPIDANDNGQADRATTSITTVGSPIAMTFGDRLYAVTDSGVVYRKSTVGGPPYIAAELEDDVVNGLVRAEGLAIVLAGDTLVDGAGGSTRLHSIADTLVASVEFDGYWSLGPVLVDLDRDGDQEIVVASPEGELVAITLDFGLDFLSAAIERRVSTDYDFTTNPVIGDIDDDGYPDVVIGGENTIYAFDRAFTILSDFPVTPSQRFTTDPVIATPIIADVQYGDCPDVVFPTQVGNIYAMGPELAFGFPLSAGEMTLGSPVYVTDSLGGRLGFLGIDGWFYLWRVDIDSTRNYWSMYGADPSGSFAFDASKLGEVETAAEMLPESRFYNYPNPVTDGVTTIRYFLGEDASSVDLAVYDLSGEKEASFTGPTAGGLDHELSWDCSGVTPGVYRCLIEVDFGGRTETAFTDIAVIR